MWHFSLTTVNAVWSDLSANLDWLDYVAGRLKYLHFELNRMYWKHFSAAIEGPTILIQVIFICQQVMLEAVRLSGQVTDNKSA